MTAPAQTREQLVCPACGNFVHQLVLATGFCRACTNEHQRGGPLHPRDWKKT